MRGRRRVINDQLLLQWIRACVSEGRYQFTDHALTEHTVTEGFTPRQAVIAIQNGTIISRRDEESRCLIRGDCPELQADAIYVGNFIHCSVQWDDVQRVVIITMYRPTQALWKNQHTRR